MKDLKHYLALFSILALAVFFFIYFSYNRQAQAGIVLATAAAYVIWGVVHHWLKKDFHLRVLVEYLVVAALAVVLLLSLLARA